MDEAADPQPFMNNSEVDSTPTNRWWSVGGAKLGWDQKGDRFSLCKSILTYSCYLADPHKPLKWPSELVDGQCDSIEGLNWATEESTNEYRRIWSETMSSVVWSQSQTFVPCRRPPTTVRAESDHRASGQQLPCKPRQRWPPAPQCNVQGLPKLVWYTVSPPITINQATRYGMFTQNKVVDQQQAHFSMSN